MFNGKRRDVNPEIIQQYNHITALFPSVLSFPLHFPVLNEQFLFGGPVFDESHEIISSLSISSQFMNSVVVRVATAGLFGFSKSSSEVAKPRLHFAF